MSILEELKRRNVIRVGVTYLVPSRTSSFTFKGSDKKLSEIGREPSALIRLGLVTSRQWSYAQSIDPGQKFDSVQLFDPDDIASA